MEFHNPTDSNKLLSDQDFLLRTLAQDHNTDLVFFAHDLEGRMTYVSESASHVLNEKPEVWHNRPYYQALTDHPWNDAIRVPSLETISRGGTVLWEIFDGNGDRVQLQTWQTAIKQNDEIVGVVGVARRLTPTNFDSSEMSSVDADVLLNRASLLSPGERQVIDLAVNGAMNKSMARTLGVAVRTIEARRARAMAKLEVRSLPDLVRTWLTIRSLEKKKNNGV